MEPPPPPSRTHPLFRVGDPCEVCVPETCLQINSSGSLAYVEVEVWRSARFVRWTPNKLNPCLCEVWLDDGSSYFSSRVTTLDPPSAGTVVLSCKERAHVRRVGGPFCPFCHTASILGGSEEDDG